MILNYNEPHDHCNKTPCEFAERVHFHSERNKNFKPLTKSTIDLSLPEPGEIRLNEPAQRLPDTIINNDTSANNFTCFCPSECTGFKEYTFAVKKIDSLVVGSFKEKDKSFAKVSQYTIVDNLIDVDEIYSYLNEMKLCDTFYLKLIYLEEDAVGNKPWMYEVDFYDKKVLRSILSRDGVNQAGVITNRYANIWNSYLFPDSKEVHRELNLGPCPFHTQPVIVITAYKETPRFTAPEHTESGEEAILREHQEEPVASPEVNSKPIFQWGQSPEIEGATPDSIDVGWGPSPDVNDKSAEKRTQPSKSESMWGPSPDVNDKSADKRIQPSESASMWGPSPDVNVNLPTVVTSPTVAKQNYSEWGASPLLNYDNKLSIQASNEPSNWGASPDRSQVDTSPSLLVPPAQTTINKIKRKYQDVIKNDIQLISQRRPIADKHAAEKPPREFPQSFPKKKKRKSALAAKVFHGIKFDTSYKIQKKESSPNILVKNDISSNSNIQKSKSNLSTGENEPVEQPGWGASP
eukprot:NODE_206_length_14836_cov_0.232408.p2 type:complete len:520 gc:universal NODE_206_length_14836_cov_0.232408:12100-10541(-)